MEYRNGKINDEINIIYTKPDRNKKIKLFGKNFVKNNNKKLKIKYNNKKYELSEYFSDYDTIFSPIIFDSVISKKLIISIIIKIYEIL